jgi:hypothetical protein
MSTNQTGHEQNVVNLGVILTRISPFQENYNPQRMELTLSGLSHLRTSSETAIAKVTAAENWYKNSASERMEAFEELDTLVTRVINALRLSGASSSNIAQAEAIVRDLRGKRIGGKTAELESGKINGNNGDTNHTTLHKGTIDSRIINFNKLIRLLSLIELYRPNETELTIAGLDTKLTQLKLLNANSVAADTALDSARWDRNAILYKPDSGLVDVALSVKMYVKSVFGATSPQYKAVSDIIFSKSR